MKLKPSLLLSVILFCLAGAVRVEATTYTVKAGGGGNYITVQACANVVAAGDICQIYPGTYNEVVNVRASGTSGNPVTFINSGTALVTGFIITAHNYITIQGLSLGNHSAAGTPGVYLSGASHVTITQCNINYTGKQAVRFSATSPSDHTVISNNVISWTGYNDSGDYAIDIYGDYNLVDSNDISHAADYTHVHGSFNVVRNNTFHDSSSTDFGQPSGSIHIDGMQTWASTTAPLHHLLMEHNAMWNTPETNVHFALLQDQTPTSDNPSDAITRYNVYYGCGSYFTMSDGIPNSRVYNNTIANVTGPPQYISSWTTEGGIGSTGGVWLNNILYNSVISGWSDIAYDRGSGPVRNGYSLVYNSGYSGTWQSSLTTEPGAILNHDPLFVNPSNDFALQSGSPAIGAGGALTKVASVDTGSGTSLAVNDAGVFQDGYTGVINADWIRIGTANTVQIAAINYSTNMITLATGVSRSPGDPVYLYKDSNGGIVLFGSAPDIGAFRYVTVAPPTNLTAYPH